MAIGGGGGGPGLWEGALQTDPSVGPGQRPQGSSRELGFPFSLFPSEWSAGRGRPHQNPEVRLRPSAPIQGPPSLPARGQQQGAEPASAVRQARRPSPFLAPVRTAEYREASKGGEEIKEDNAHTSHSVVEQVLGNPHRCLHQGRTVMGRPRGPQVILQTWAEPPW